MINAITTKIEIDVMQQAELDQAIQLAVAHTMPAIVVHQQLVAQAHLLRIKRRGLFKIIVPIDWPKGDTYGMLKLRGITSEVIQSDGFEIMLTDKSEPETRNEVKLLSTFIRTQFTSNPEIRFVLGCFTRPETTILKICKTMKDIPVPAFLRIDHHLKMQVTKANIKTHTALIEKIKPLTGTPIKLSGNIDTVRVVAGCIKAGASRLAVNLQQMQNIIKELQKQPDELRRLLDDPAPITETEIVQ